METEYQPIERLKCVPDLGSFFLVLIFGLELWLVHLTCDCYTTAEGWKEGAWLTNGPVSAVCMYACCLLLE